MWVDVDVETAWVRVRDGDRPLARDETAFKRLFDERRSLYRDAADDVVVSVDDVLLAALQIHVGRGLVSRLDVPPPFAVIADEYVLECIRSRFELSELQRLPAAKQPSPRRCSSGSGQPRARPQRHDRRYGGGSRPTSPVLRPRRTFAACAGSRCRRRCSGRSMPRSAARPRSTCPPARTSSAPSTIRPR